MKISFLAILTFSISSIFAMTIPQGKRVIVTNPIDVYRPAETISVPWSKLEVEPNDSSVRVWDMRLGKALAFQDDGKGNIIFSTPLKPFEKRLFAILKDAKLPQADMSIVCWAKHVPERKDDFAWENDKFGARTYGQMLMEAPPKGEKLISSGIDIFNKCVSYPTFPKWLYGKGEGSYHKNHGEGMDVYMLGKARGVGGIGQYKDGKWSHSINWKDSKVIMVGPVRAEFEIVYDSWGNMGKETRHVTIDRGQNFAKYTATFSSPLQDVFVGPGLDINDKRTHDGDMKFSLKRGFISNFEPVAKPEDGQIATAIILDPLSKTSKISTDELDCIYLLSTLSNEGSITYWAGSSWSLAGDYTTPQEWHNAVEDFTKALNNPVKITVK
jgi:hypothetical protein